MKKSILLAFLVFFGMAGGRWGIFTKNTDAVLTLRPFGTFPRAFRAAAIEEGEALARFIGLDAKTHGARIIG
jgi:hypothetical protein